MITVPRESSLWYTICTPSGTLPKHRPLRALFCRHETTTIAVVIDHTAGAGWMADNHEVEVCDNCGRVVSRRLVY